MITAQPANPTEAGTTASRPDRPVDDADALYVITATDLSTGGGRLTLHGLSPSTIYIADRPDCEVGHLTSRQFIRLWTEAEGRHGFASDPPSAILSYFERENEAPREAVLVLDDPILTDDALSYAAVVLEGILPARAGPCSVFIDASRQPLAPVCLIPVRRADAPIAG